MSPILIFCVWWCVIVQATCINGVSHREEDYSGLVVRRESRRTLVSTENGEILAARVAAGDICGGGGGGGGYLLHFFTMDPNSLFLPVVLHSDMVFYVHTGSGKLSWTEENELKTTDLRRGDVYRLKEGAVFFIQSNLETETERKRLRINAIFANSNTDMHEPYSSIRDMVIGFDKKVLQAAFKVPEEEIEELLNQEKPSAIVHGVSRSRKRAYEMEARILGSLMGSRTYNVFELNKKKGKGSARLFNLFKESKDFENCNGWSTTVTGKKLSALKGTGIGLFMVNLTTGSMMGPHWNPTATEVAVVLQGRGMVHVVCSEGSLNETGCRNTRFEVEEGDVFAVPRFHPMAQMAFNNETFVFMGFSSSEKRNHPQYLAGQASVLRTLSEDVLAVAFNVENTTLDRLLASQHDSVILGCISCAEEELRILEEERGREREEEREEEEEEAREREEERRREEEEARKREEEEAKREEEERKRQEEEEEEAKRQEEEAAKRHEEEEAEAKRQEEERRRREEEEEEAKRREEERKRREEEEEEAREEEEEEAREEEEEAKRQEEKRKRREEEAREEEERRRREEEEEEEAREEEEEAKRQEEKRKRREEEEEAAERREAEEERRRQEERKRRREHEEEEEIARREEEAEEERRRQEERKRRREHEEEEEIARREEEERRRREEEQEEEKERRWEEEEEEGRRREEQHGRRRRSEEEEAAEEEERRWEEEEEEGRRREEQHGRRRRRRSEEAEAAEEEERERGKRGRIMKEKKSQKVSLNMMKIKVSSDVYVWEIIQTCLIFVS